MIVPPAFIRITPFNLILVVAAADVAFKTVAAADITSKKLLDVAIVVAADETKTDSYNIDVNVAVPPRPKAVVCVVVPVDK